MNTCLSLPDDAARASLTEYEAVLRTVLPLKAAHRKELHFAVADLSRALTTERGGLKVPYWTTPRTTSAYLHFYLPWNLYRLAWLLPTLSLDLKDGDTVLDLGCGPLTLAQALWMFRPELRTRQLTFLCADIAPKPMETGRRLLETLMGPTTPWRVFLERAPLEKALRTHFGKAALVCGANVLNELHAGKGQSLEERMTDLALFIREACAPGGTALFVEPGTRLGGKMVSLLRQGLMTHGLFPHTPCPHTGDCPMLAQHANGWCHFNAPAEQAPAWLMSLTNRARMDRRNVSLSFLHATQDMPPVMEDAVRVLSDPIKLPDTPEAARYACSAHGLALLHKARRFHNGSLVRVAWPDPSVTDAKSRARIALPAEQPHAPAAPAASPTQQRQVIPGAKDQKKRNTGGTPMGSSARRSGSR